MIKAQYNAPSGRVPTSKEQLAQLWKIKKCEGALVDKPAPAPAAAAEKPAPKAPTPEEAKRCAGIDKQLAAPLAVMSAAVRPALLKERAKLRCPGEPPKAAPKAG